MKTTLILGLALFALKANAYTSAPSGDPVLGFRDVELRTVAKVDSVAGYDDAITKGMGVFFEDGTGDPSSGYKVSINYSGTYNTAIASKFSACIAARNVATGDLGGFPCAVKGYVDYALYSAVTLSAPIAIGDYLCISDQASVMGRLVKCGSGITSPYISLETKSTTGTGAIKVQIVSP